MTRNDSTIVDEIWEAAARSFPVLSPEEQRAGIVLLRELAEGEPVTIAQLARALGAPVAATEALVRDSPLTPLVYGGDAGQIQGFCGLSVVRTPHQLTVNGRTLWTWCAYDTLFVPRLLDETAAIETRDPETAELIRLTVSPARVEVVKPDGIVVSMVPPATWDVTSALRIMASACHFMFFFASRASGEGWRAKHPDTVLLSLDEAFAIGERSNAHLFGPELAKRRTNAA